MERRKDTLQKGVKLPKPYLELVEDVFNKNFSKNLLKEKGKKEKFVVFGEMYPDELVLAISLQNPTTFRMTTCYASVDYPPKAEEKESKKASDHVQTAVNDCVDAVASFFQSFFDDGRPVDYDLEYRQNWTVITLENKRNVYLRINHDNLDLEAQADAILEKDDEVTKKNKKLH